MHKRTEFITYTILSQHSEFCFLGIRILGIRNRPSDFYQSLKKLQIGLKLCTNGLS